MKLITVLLMWVAIAPAYAIVTPAPDVPGACAITQAVTGTCYELDVMCESIPSRRVRIRQLDVSPGVPVVGNVLFTTGNTGMALYGAPGTPERVGTVLGMHNSGYRTFEVTWLGADGWLTGAHGFGWRRALCAYAEVVRYLADPAPEGGNKMPENTLGGVRGKNIRAAGNSGGSAQIAYGMTAHDLESYLSVAVYSAGPPISDLAGICFATQYDGASNPTGLAIGPAHPGRVITDKALGFYSPIDVPGFNYCTNYPRPAGETGSGVLPPSLDAFDADSLVSKGAAAEPRDYSAPRTCQRFVHAEFDNTGAQNQGEIYYQKVVANQPTRTITYDVPGSTNHDIDATAAGAAAVRSRLLADCPAPLQVVEYRNTLDFAGSPGGHFFYTADAAEQAAIDEGSAGRFQRTGASFNAAGPVQVCRFYGSLSPGPNSHFFSAVPAECAALQAQQVTPMPATVQQWNFEGPGFPIVRAEAGAGGATACPAGTVPIYRAYNNAFTAAGRNAWDSNHRYALSPMAIGNLVTQFGWRDEGIAFCAQAR